MNPFVVQYYIPQAVEAGKAFSVSFTVRNDGTDLWEKGGPTPVSVGAVDANGAPLGGDIPYTTGRIMLPWDVPPGGQVTIAGTLSAPPENTLGPPCRYRMLRETVGAAGEIMQRTNLALYLKMIQAFPKVHPYGGGNGWEVFPTVKYDMSPAPGPNQPAANVVRYRRWYGPPDRVLMIVAVSCTLGATGGSSSDTGLTLLRIRPDDNASLVFSTRWDNYPIVSGSGGAMKASPERFILPNPIALAPDDCLQVEEFGRAVLPIPSGGWTYDYSVAIWASG